MIEVDGDSYNYFAFLHVVKKSKSKHSKSILKDIKKYIKSSESLTVKKYNISEYDYNITKEIFHSNYPDLDIWEFDISNLVTINPWFRNNGYWKYCWGKKSIEEIFRLFRNPGERITLIRSKYCGRDIYNLHYAINIKKRYIKENKKK